MWSNFNIEVLGVKWLFEVVWEISELLITHTFMSAFILIVSRSDGDFFQFERPCLIVALHGHLCGLFELTRWWLHSNMGSISGGQPRLFEILPIQQPPNDGPILHSIRLHSMQCIPNGS